MRGGLSATPSSRRTSTRQDRSPRYAEPTPPPPASEDILNGTRPNATFTSCLSIPVQGAVPIEAPSAHAPSRMSRAQPPPAASAPVRSSARKSKLDALAALKIHRDSSSPEPDYYEESVPLPAPTIPAAPVNQSLDMSKVRTSSPRYPSSPGHPRPFGLQDCPTYYPTAEEFADPMSYVNTISPEAAQYGICKIVPPEGWKMPFVTDTETFRFKTRLQRLNSIEASSRAKLNFLEQLYRFHKQQGNPRVSVPTINHKSLDLWLLRKEVQKLGGYDEVTRTKKWADLGRILGYTGVPGLSAQIKNSYTRVILPYEHFCEHVRNSPALSPMKMQNGQTPLRTALAYQTALKQSNNMADASASMNDSGSPSSSRGSSPLSEVPEEDLRRLKHGLNGDADDDVLPTVNGYDNDDEKKITAEQSCEVCHKKDFGEEMLLCDGCDCGFHMFCLDPPLEVIPKDEWFCHTCLFGTGGDFGFDEGEEHSLASFQARDYEFRKMWFKSHPPRQVPGRENDPLARTYDDVVVAESDVEEEFWRLVQSQLDTVEIEYGADVHSTTHGSGMPTLESHPLNGYSKDPWNLNNMPILPQSLLRYIKSDISGMTVPWTYVGMVFSTFCWHNEDHHTSSINFMHWGETKTWYGIPGDDAEKFESAIKQEAPDLFEAQPDLLYQLTTLMNPDRLTGAGVRVYGCNQRPGEFVITFPKAYHAGFNHGLNFNEAVNFALPNWLPLGLGCVQQYREYKKQPVFSHDELLITVTQQSSSIETAIWLVDALRDMVDREIEGRHNMRSYNVREVLEEQDRGEDQYSCKVCKTFCYLSQVTCQCTRDNFCFEHFEQCCECPMEQRTLCTRFSDDALIAILRDVEQRSVAPTTWRNKMVKLLSLSARPSLDDMITLVEEGDRIDHPIPELSMLRKCVTRGRKWMEAAGIFLEDRKPSSASRYRPHDRSISHITTLLEDVVNLGFSSPVIDALDDIRNRALRCQVKAKDLIAKVEADGRDVHLPSCEVFLHEIAAIPVWIEEFGEIQKVVGGQQLVQELRRVLEQPGALDLEQVQDFIQRAEAHNFSEDDEQLVILKARERKGRAWVNQANALLGGRKHKSQLISLIQVDNRETPVDFRVMDHLKAALARFEEWDHQAMIWGNEQHREHRPTLDDVARLLKRSRDEFEHSPIMKNLSQQHGFAIDLEDRCEEVLSNQYQHKEDRCVFEMLDTWRDYAHKHLDMFILPKFDKLESHIKLHRRWVEGLPWYSHNDGKIEGQKVLEDAIEATRPNDDVPPADPTFSCICPHPVMPPAPGEPTNAVQCDNCAARFHGPCMHRARSCPFCDQKHWDGSEKSARPWHFAYLQTVLFSAPEISRNYSKEWKHLEIIVHRVDRLANNVGQFLVYLKHPQNQRSEYLAQARHFLRKLHRLQFVVAPSVDQSYGLELSGLHRVLATLPSTATRSMTKKRKRPKFHFGQDSERDWDDGTRCICRGRTAYLLNYPTVECEICSRLYHESCVFFPPKSDQTQGKGSFICPLCCVRKGRPYANAEVRVKDPNVKEDNTFVNTFDMLETFSKEMMYMKLPQPFRKTLFVDLARFVPGQPEYVINQVPLMSRQSMPPVLEAYRDPPPALESYYHVLENRPAPMWNATTRHHAEASASNGRQRHAEPSNTNNASRAMYLPHAAPRGYESYPQGIPPPVSGPPSHHAYDSNRHALPHGGHSGVPRTGHPPQPSIHMDISMNSQQPEHQARKRKNPDDRPPSGAELHRASSKRHSSSHHVAADNNSANGVDGRRPHYSTMSTDRRDVSGPSSTMHSVSREPQRGRHWPMDPNNPEAAYMSGVASRGLTQMSPSPGPIWPSRSRHPVQHRDHGRDETPSGDSNGSMYEQ